VRRGEAKVERQAEPLRGESARVLPVGREPAVFDCEARLPERAIEREEGRSNAA